MPPDSQLSDAVPGESPQHEDVQQLIEAESGTGSAGVLRRWLASDSVRAGPADVGRIVLISDSGGVKLSRDNGTTAPAQVVVDGTTAGGVLSGTFPSPGFAAAPTFTGPVQINGALTVTGATQLATLGVPGATTLTTLTVTGLSALQTLTAQATTLQTLTVTGLSAMATLEVASTAEVDGALTVGGALYVTGLTTLQTLDVLDDLHLAGSATLGDAATDAVQIPGTLLVVNDAEFRADLVHKGAFLGLFNQAPTTKQTVSGSRGANVALTNLCAALANYGLITNSTTA